MTNLTLEEQNNLWNLRNKLVHRQASSSDMRQLLDLILRSSQNNHYEIENYVHSIGYNTINDFQRDLEQKNRDELVNALLIIGGAVLLAMALSKLKR